MRSTPGHGAARPRAIRLLVLMIGAISAAAPAGALRAAEPERPAAWTPALMMKIKQVGSVQVSPDGKRAVFAVRRAVTDGDKSEYRTRLYLADADGGREWPLTPDDQSCDDPQWSPEGRWIAFVSERSGKRNLWVIRPDGGEAVRLSEVKTAVGNYKWAPDGRALAFTALDGPTSEEEAAARAKTDARVVDENVKRNRLYVIPFTDPPKLQSEARLLTPGDLSVTTEGNRAGRAPFDWSPDGKTIAFSHTRVPGPNDWIHTDLARIDAAGGAVRPLVHAGAAATTPFYSPDGASIAYVASDVPAAQAGSGRIHVISADGGTDAALAETADGFGRYSEIVGWSADGKRIYFTEAWRTNLRLMAMPLQGPPVEIGREEGMASAGVFLNAHRSHFGFAWETLSRPPEAFVGAADRFAPVQVSRVQPDVSAAPLGRTELVRWKSKDGLEIEGFLTYPVGYEKGRRYPLLLIVHGGPMGAYMQTFDGTAAYHPVAAFASRGYAVLRPNPRGSVGYGRKFRRANYGDWGGGDFADLMAGVDRIIDLGVADADRLGVMGWSYGGYVTAWAVTRTKRFRAASVGGGVTDLASFTGTADIPDFLPDFFGGEFWDKPGVYQAHSPMFHVKGVNTPTLIQHGELDTTVPLSQGEELYNALKRQGCATKMVVYPRSHHGIEEPRLLVDCMERNLEWFDRYVRGAFPKGEDKP